MLKLSTFFFLTTFISLFIIGCVHVESVAGPFRDQNCAGNIYTLKVDCYVVRPPWKDKTLLLSPDQAPFYRLPLPVGRKYVGQSCHGYEIVDVMTKGTEVRVVDVKRIWSAEVDDVMPYVCANNDQAEKPLLFNAYRLFSRDTGNLKIVSSYAEPKATSK